MEKPKLQNPLSITPPFLKPISQSTATYLLTIDQLEKQNGSARLIDIATTIGITKGSCSLTLKSLKKRGLVEEREKRTVGLTGQAHKYVTILSRNDVLISTFFHEILGMNEQQAETDAGKIEHLLSSETISRLAQLVNLMKSSHISLDTLKTAVAKNGLNEIKLLCDQLKK